MNITDKIVGTYTSNNKAKFKGLTKRVFGVTKFKNMSLKELSAYSIRLKQDIISSNKSLESEDTLVDALALCKEIIFKVTSLKTDKNDPLYTGPLNPYACQIEAAIAMNSGAVVQMHTGEGKTLVQNLIAYLHALKGETVHVMTSNEYLSSRDQKLNADIFTALGFSSSFVPSTPKLIESENITGNEVNERKRQLYSADIVYGVASTFAFDYLEDNQVLDSKDKKNPKEFGYAIVDEVDSILLDESIVPFILTNRMKLNNKELEERTTLTNLYKKINKMIQNGSITCKIVQNKNANDAQNMRFTEDCILYNKNGEVLLADKAYDKVLNILGLKEFDENDIEFQKKYSEVLNALNSCILANFYYKRNVNYIVSNNKKDIVLIDKNTGRLLPGRRLDGGLHECLEVKHGIESNSVNLVTGECMYPDFFSMYESGISGMSGTIDSTEFEDLYNIPTYKVDSRKKNIRKDEKMKIYSNKKSKYKAMIEDIVNHHYTMQPVLVGTSSVLETQEICDLLEEYGIRYNRLDAVNSQYESDIVACAGQIGQVTVATNMAGRGTDIKLGSSVKELGGLYVISSTINRNNRLDDQLKGRCARQGEAGKTKTYVSFEDEIIKMRYGTDYYKMAEKFSNSKGELNQGIFSKLVCGAQKTEESRDKKYRLIKKQFSDVTSQHRKEFYKARTQIINNNSIDITNKLIVVYVNDLFESSSEEEIKSKLSYMLNVPEKLEKSSIISSLKSKLVKSSRSDERFDSHSKLRMCRVIDSYWMDFLAFEDEERERLLISSYGTSNLMGAFITKTKIKYDEMVKRIQNEILTYVLRPDIPFGNYNIKKLEIQKEKELEK